MVPARSFRFMLGLLLVLSLAPLRGVWSQSTPVSDDSKVQQAVRAAAQAAFDEGETLCAVQTKEGFQQALRKFEESLVGWRAVGDRAMEAEALFQTGKIHDFLGDKPKALENLNAALTIWRELGDERKEITGLLAAAEYYQGTGERLKAQEFLEQARSRCRNLGNCPQEIDLLTNLGENAFGLGRMSESVEYLNQAAELSRKANDQGREAVALNNLGRTYIAVSEYSKAAEAFTRSLPLRRAVGDLRGEANSLTGLGLIHSRLGEKLKALDYYNQALVLFRKAGYVYGEASIYNNLGSIYTDINEFQKALDAHEHALPLRRSVGDRSGEALTLHNIGNTYNWLGDEEKAADYYRQALALNRELGNSQGEAGDLSALADLRVFSDGAESAHDLQNQVLAIHRKTGNRRDEITTLVKLARIYMTRKDPRKALEVAEQSLDLARSAADPFGIIEALTMCARIRFETGNLDQAAAEYAEALTRSRAVFSPRRESFLLYLLSLLELKRGNLSVALKSVEESVRIIEDLRSKVVRRDLRGTFFTSTQQRYDAYVEILMRLHARDPKAGHDQKAFEVSELSRTKNLLEMLGEARADIRQGVDPKLLERERELGYKLATKTEDLTRLATRNAPPDKKAPVQRELDDLAAEYEVVQTRIRQASPRYAALATPAPTTAKSVQAALDPDTVLLEYRLGKNTSYAWTVTCDEIAAFELPSADEIEKAVVEIRDLAAHRKPSDRRGGEADETTFPQSSARLSDLILKPVADRLDKKRVVIVADGALHYVPFAALPVPSGMEDGKVRTRFPLLLERSEVVMLPSAATLDLLRREAAERGPATKTVAVLADPVFSKTDRRVQQSAKNGESPSEAGETRNLTVLSAEKAAKETIGGRDAIFPRLLGTRREARTILSFVPPGQGKGFFDFDADRSTVLDSDLGQYRILHFATHGFLNNARPELSGLILSLVDKQGRDRNGFLLTPDVFNLKLSADLVVLSACETGLGKRQDGEGLVGLTRGFMYAGVPRVVVSLWSVDDRATAELMSKFYRGVLREKLRPAEALRNAQLQLRGKKGWESPYYWAAFVLQGEWN